MRNIAIFAPLLNSGDVAQLSAIWLDDQPRKFFASNAKNRPSWRVILCEMRMETDDETLAHAAGQGDRAAFAALIDRHYDRVFRMCWHLTRAEDQAEDLTQEICLKLPRALRGYRSEAKFTTWLYRVVLNAARDVGRRQATRSKAMEGYGREATLAGSAEGEEDRALWLDRAMGALKPDLSETAALIVGQELTQAEAAEALDISPGTVAWRMSEVKKALAAMARADVEADRI